MQSTQNNNDPFNQFITIMKSGNIQQTQNILNTLSSQVINKIEQKSQQPALHLSAFIKDEKKSLEMIKLLIRYGADPSYKDQYKQTIVFYLCRQGKADCVEYILMHGLSLDQVDRNGQTPIFYAASQNKLEIVKRFGTKERVNIVDYIGHQTPLFYAVKKGHIQMVMLLIQKGSDPNHLDSSGKSPLDYAKKFKNNQLIQLFSSQNKRQKQVTKLINVSQSVDQSNIQKRRRKQQIKPTKITYKIVFTNEKGQTQDLTQQKVRQLLRERPQFQAYLANPQLIPNDLQGGQEWVRSASKILAECIKYKGSYWFLQPVDPVKFNILDYFDVIKRPMDLGTIKKKINYNCYGNAKQFVDDMNLIWLNCYRYNGQQHDISKCAKQIQSIFKKAVTNNALDKYL